MRAGMAWFAAGSVVVIATWLLRPAGGGPIVRYGPFLLMFAGAYGLVVGIEKMVAGYRAGRASTDAATRARVGRQTLAGALLLVVSVAAGAGVWAYRAPYWKAVRTIGAGDGASARLRAIAERHVAAIESGASGQDALASWRRSADEALPLRPQFEAALEGARYLRAEATGTMRTRGEIDAQFYALCLEWMDLYATVQRALQQESMMEPPEDWARRQNDIVDRIQSLPPPPEAGS